MVQCYDRKFEGRTIGLAKVTDSLVVQVRDDDLMRRVVEPGDGEQFQWRVATCAGRVVQVYARSLQVASVLNTEPDRIGVHVEGGVGTLLLTRAPSNVIWSTPPSERWYAQNCIPMLQSAAVSSMHRKRPA